MRPRTPRAWETRRCRPAREPTLGPMLPLRGFGYAIRARFRSARVLAAGFRSASVRGYQRRYGLAAAIPIAWGSLDVYALPGWSALGFLATALFLEPRPGRRLAFLAFLFACAAVLGEVRRAPPAGLPLDGGFLLEGKVDGFPVRQRQTAFTLETARGRFRVKISRPGSEPLPGQRVRCRARLHPPAPPTNPGQFDYGGYLRSQNLAGVLEAEEMFLLEDPGPWDRLVIAVRKGLSAGLERAVPAAQAPLLKAALLGETDEVDPALIEDFKGSGMLHILAISGQHVGVIALILLQAFALLRLPRKAAFLATGAVLALYVPVCGGQISVLRAALMFWAGVPAVLWERPASALNSLGWAAAGILASMPWSILSLGFQLSFAATFLLILYSRTLAEGLARLKIRRALTAYLASTPALSLALFLGAYPLLAAVSHVSSPSSILGNVATIGISSGMLVAACLALLAAPWTALSACFGATAGAFGTALAFCVHTLARAPGAAVAAPSLHPAWGLGLIAAVIAFPHAVRLGKGRILVLFCAAAFSGRWAGLAVMEARAPARVDFLDVGQGDATVLRLRGAVILIDAGPEPAGREAIVPWLRQAGIDRIDLAVVTHPDLDHYGGLAYVAEHIAISAVAHPGLDAETQAWRNLKAVLAAQGIPMRAAARGQVFYAGAGDTLRVLSPERPGQYGDRNDNSVVTLLRTRGNRILFTGDLGPEAETRLLALEPDRLAGAILKVPHHGSDLSNPYGFLAAVKPGVALLSAGRANKFGHPGPATVSALRGLDAALFLTARDGAVAWSDCDDLRGGRWATYLGTDTSLAIAAPPRKPRKPRPAGSRGRPGREYIDWKGDARLPP